MAENDNNLKELQRLRTFLNPAIKGKVTNAILESLATGSGYMVDQIEAVNEQLYIATASGQYLDQRLADYNLTRPAAVGLSDDVFREIGINVINSKQIRYLIEQLLLAMFGEEAANSTSSSTEFEPYNLDDGDMLIVGFDGQPSSTVIFNSSQFTNISSASALEVADAITRGLRSQGKSGSAFAKDDGAGGYVVLLSDTTGPSSSVTVLGGRAQNILKFEAIRPTTAGPSTTWTVSQISGGSLRYTWTAGANPSIGKVRENDYVNIYGTSFNTANQGTYTVTTVKSGTVGNAYFELDNPNGIVEVVVQGTVDSILFFNPFVSNMSTKQRFAAAYQTQTNILNIFIPATTKVVRRSRVGSAHLHELNLPSTPDTYGPYVYDLSQPFVISSAAGTTASTALDSDSGRVISVTDSSQFPDSPGNIILGYGTSHQEGPIPYLARPSNTSLLLNPSYTIINNHPIGTDVALISQLGPVVIAKDGSDYPFFVTDIVSGRTYAEDLINAIVATGITTVITIVYPGDIGLGKWGTQYSEKTYIWGPDPQ